MAKRAGAALRGLTAAPWAAVYSSPFYRCLQTANEIAAELQLPVRVEPGLSELCIERIFDQPPQLRSPDISLQSALTRTSADCSTAPVQPSLPQWPEQARFANTRVLQTATELAARHPRQAICLVCHSHSVVELSRHLPSSGGGATPSHADYCALSQVSFGRLVRCLDTTYMRESSATSSRDTMPSDNTAENQPCGTWTKGWNWVGDGASADVPDVQASSQLETLFELSLDEVLEQHPAFRELFSRGSSEKQQAFRNGWTVRDMEVRAKLQQAKDLGLLVFAT
jgi:broad specificity phosphatase PhoE